MGTLLLIPLLTAGLATPGGSVPMTLHKIVDDKGIHGVAYNYLAPKGWKTTAQLAWTNRILQPTVLNSTAESPDGRFGYALLSGIDFAFSGIVGGQQFYGNPPGMQGGVQPPERLSAFLEDMLRKDPSVSDLKVTKRADRPLTARELPPYRNGGMASEIDYTFTKGGRTLVGVTAARMDLNVEAGSQPGMVYNGDWELTNAYTITFPAGEEKKAMRFFSLGVPTYTPTKAFVVARGAYLQALDRQLLDESKALAEMTERRHQMNQQQENAIMGNYRSQQNARDKFQRDFCDYIGDTRRSRNTDGTELLTNANDGQPWSDGRGNYMFGDNPGGGWTALKPMGG